MQYKIISYNLSMDCYILVVIIWLGLGGFAGQGVGLVFIFYFTATWIFSSLKALSGNTFAHGLVWNSGYVLVRSLRLHIMIQNTAAIRLYIRSDPKPETGNGIGRWCRDLGLSTFVECNSIALPPPTIHPI